MSKRSQFRADARRPTFSNVPNVSARIKLQRDARRRASKDTAHKIAAIVIIALSVAWVVGQLIH